MSQDAVVQLLGTGRDITERKVVERAHRAFEQRMLESQELET
jgi:hypothetical protein